MGLFDWIRGDKPQSADTAEHPTQAAQHGRWDGVSHSTEPRGPSIADMLAALPRGPMATAAVGDACDPNSRARLEQSPISEAQFGYFANQGFIGHQTAAYIAQNWLVLKACDMPARDALRNGWRVVAMGGELDDLDRQVLERADNRYGIKKVLRDFLTKGRIFGVRIAIPRIRYSDQKAYELPFNIDGVEAGSFEGWVTVDPYWAAPEVPSMQPDQLHFYEPEYWIIGGKRYHRSHLIIYRHGVLADVLKPAYLYGGIPLPQLIAERVYGAERAASEAPLLALTKRTVVYKTDLEKALANYDLLEEKTRQMNAFWNNYGMRVIDKDADEHQQFDTALADLDALIMTQYQLVASAAEVPSTKLMGTSPKGFNATGEHDEANYHESLESIQENDLAPLVDRHLQLVQKSMGIAKGLTLYCEWNPLDVSSDADRAAAAAARAQAAAALISAGVVAPTEERTRLNAEDGGEYSGILTGAAPEGLSNADEW